MKFRKKNTVTEVNAVRWDGQHKTLFAIGNLSKEYRIQAWSVSGTHSDKVEGHLLIKDLAEPVKLTYNLGDWIVKHNENHYTIEVNETFRNTYEPINGPASSSTNAWDLWEQYYMEGGV